MKNENMDFALGKLREPTANDAVKEAVSLFKEISRLIFRNRAKFGEFARSNIDPLSSEASETFERMLRRRVFPNGE